MRPGMSRGIDCICWRAETSMSQKQLRLKREKNSRKSAGAERWHLLEQYAVFLWDRNRRPVRKTGGLVTAPCFWSRAKSYLLTTVFTKHFHLATTCCKIFKLHFWTIIGAIWYFPIAYGLKNDLPYQWLEQMFHFLNLWIYLHCRTVTLQPIHKASRSLIISMKDIKLQE